MKNAGSRISSVTASSEVDECHGEPSPYRQRGIANIRTRPYPHMISAVAAVCTETTDDQSPSVPMKRVISAITAIARCSVLRWTAAAAPVRELPRWLPTKWLPTRWSPDR